MLQQTQVSRVMARYGRSWTRFPDPRSLAARTARRRRSRCGRGSGTTVGASVFTGRPEIVARFGGSVPRSVEDLESLPGVGPYTARAVAVFAFDSPSRSSRPTSAGRSSTGSSPAGSPCTTGTSCPSSSGPWTAAPAGVVQRPDGLRHVARRARCRIRTVAAPTTCGSPRSRDRGGRCAGKVLALLVGGTAATRGDPRPRAGHPGGTARPDARRAGGRGVSRGAGGSYRVR